MALESKTVEFSEEIPSAFCVKRTYEKQGKSQETETTDGFTVEWIDANMLATLDPESEEYACWLDTKQQCLTLMEE